MHRSRLPAICPDKLMFYVNASTSDFGYHHRFEVGIHVSGCQLSPGFFALSHGFSGFGVLASVVVGSGLELGSFGAGASGATVAACFDVALTEPSPAASGGAGC